MISIPLQGSPTNFRHWPKASNFWRFNTPHPHPAICQGLSLLVVCFPLSSSTGSSSFFQPLPPFLSMYPSQPKHATLIHAENSCFLMWSFEPEFVSLKSLSFKSKEGQMLMHHSTNIYISGTTWYTGNTAFEQERQGSWFYWTYVLVKWGKWQTSNKIIVDISKWKSHEENKMRQRGRRWLTWRNHWAFKHKSHNVVNLSNHYKCGPGHWSWTMLSFQLKFLFCFNPLFW